MKCQVHLARYPFIPAECRSKHGGSFHPASSLPPPHSCCPDLRRGTRAAGCEPPVPATMDWERNQARGSNRKRKWRRGGTSEQLGNKGRAQRHREAWKRIGSTGTDFKHPGSLLLPFLSNFSIFLHLILSMARPSPVGAVAQMQWRNRRGRTTRGQEDATIHAEGWARAQWQVELLSHVKAFNTCSEFWV